MSFSIAGKTAVVTGAANGVGLSIARHFVKAGANVMFADMDEARLAEEVGEDDDMNGTAAYYAGDLREKLTIANLLSATIDAGSAPRASSRRYRFSCSRRYSRASRASENSSASIETGFMSTSRAPYFIAATADSIVACAVHRRTGRSGQRS